MKLVFGRISMCFLISGHTSKVSFKAVLALSGRRYGFISIMLRRQVHSSNNGSWPGLSILVLKNDAEAVTHWKTVKENMPLQVKIAILLDLEITKCMPWPVAKDYNTVV